MNQLSLYSYHQQNNFYLDTIYNMLYNALLSFLNKKIPIFRLYLITILILGSAFFLSYILSYPIQRMLSKQCLRFLSKNRILYTTLIPKINLYKLPIILILMDFN